MANKWLTALENKSKGKEKEYTNETIKEGFYGSNKTTESSYNPSNKWLGKLDYAEKQRSYVPDNNYYVKQDIEKATQTFTNNGLDVPMPDEKEKLKKKNWFERLTDPLSALQYGVARGVRNLVDDKSETGFFQGAKEGFSAGMEGTFSGQSENLDKRTSWKEVLDTLLNSKNETKQNVGAGITNATTDPKLILKGLSKIGNVIPSLNNPVFSGLLETASNKITGEEDVKKRLLDVERAKEHTMIPGLVGDIALDPLNAVAGLGGATKILAKGSDVVSMPDKLGDVKKATEILKGFGRTEDVAKEANYLVNKTAKTLGYMNDYEGVKILGKTVLAPETIGKIADSTLGKIISPILNVPAKIGSAIGETKAMKELTSKLGGAYHDFYSFAKSNPEQAMNSIAYVDEMKKLVNEQKIGKLKTIKKVQDAESVIKGYDTEITRLQELGDTQKKIEEIVKMPNEAKAELFAKERENLNVKMQELADQIEELKMKLDSTTDLQTKVILADRVSKLDNIKAVQENIVKMSDEQLESTLGKVNTIKETIKEAPKKESTLEILKPLEETKRVETEAKKLRKEIEELKKDHLKELGRSNVRHDKLADIEKQMKEKENALHELTKPSELPKEKPKKASEEEIKAMVKGETEVVKPTVDTKLEETYNKLNEKKLNDLSEETYNALIKTHEDLKLPLNEETKDRYRSLNEYEAKDEIKFLHNKEKNRRKLNSEHTVVNKLGKEKKISGSIDYIDELSEKTKTKPRFNTTSEDFFENNIGFRNIEKARLERKLNKKSITESGEIGDRMAEQLADALVNSFPDAKWLKEAGDDLTNDLKYLTKREFDTVWDSVKKANTKPYESKRFKNYSSFNDDAKVIGRDESVTAKDRTKWVQDEKRSTDIPPLDRWEGNDFEYVKHLMDTNSDEIDNISEGMVHGIIERDLDKIELDKEYQVMNKEFYDKRLEALPMTDKQLGFVQKQIKYIKDNRPDIYNIIKEEFKPNGKSRNTIAIASRGQAGRFLDRVKELTGDSELALKELTKEQSSFYIQKLNKKAQALWSKGKELNNKEMQDLANTAQKYLKNKQIKNYSQYKMLSDKLQSHFAKETVVKKLVEEVKPKQIAEEIRDVKKATKAKAEMAQTALETPKKDLINTVNTVQEKVTVDNYKNTIDAMANALQNNISKLEEEYNNLSKTLESKRLFNKYMKEKYGDMPNFIKAKKETVVTESAFKDLPEEVRQIAEAWREDFKKYGIEENIPKEKLEGLYKYVAHIISPENKKKIPFGDIKLELKNPKNVHAKHRDVFGDMTIQEINKFMEEKHGVKNFMENRMSYIYLKRSLDNNKYIFDKKNTENFMNTFAKPFDLHLRPNDGDKVGWNKWWEMKNKFDELLDSGEYTIVRLDDDYKAESHTVIKGDSLETVANHNINISPTVEINPEDIKKADYFEKNKQTLYLVPKEMHKQYIDVMKGQFLEHESTLKKMAEGFMTAWKAQALLGMGYHTNNFIGNTFNSFLSVGSKIFDPKRNADAVKVYSAYKGVEGAKDSVILGKKASDWVDILQKYGIFEGTQSKVDLGSFLNGKTTKISAKESPLSKLAKSNINPFVASQNIGEAIENQARLTNFFIHIGEGKSVQEAVDLTNKFLFDYSDLSKFEQSTMKKIMPFYTWFRKNLPLQAEQLLKQPEKYTGARKVQNALSKDETDEEKMYKPEYLDGAIHTGKGKYVKINMPYEDLKKAVDPTELMGSINPFAKLAIELGTNKNLYFNSPIENYDGETTEAKGLYGLLGKDTPNGKMISKKGKYALDTLLPTPKNINSVIDGKQTAFAQGIVEKNVNVEDEKQRAIYNYLKKLEDAKKKAKKEGYAIK